MNFKRNFWYFVLHMICTMAWAEEEIPFTKERELHQPKTLSREEMRKLAELSSESTEMNYFREQLLKPILRVRDPGTEGNRQVQEHIKFHMGGLGWRLDEDSFTDDIPGDTKTFTTIIATQNPAALRKLVIACHHDSKLFQDFQFIAATDSAVPCAMMLDLARLMNSTLWKEDNNKVQDVSLQFIFFDGNEAFVRWTATDSLYGARHLAKKMTDNLVEVGQGQVVREIDTIDVMLLLNLIGTNTTQFRNWFPKTENLHERLQQIETKLIRESLLEPPGQFFPNSNKYFVGGLARGGVQDDHQPFLDEDVPIVHMISSPFPAQWHTEDDNERALDYPTIDNINKILRVFVAEYLHLSP